MMYSLSDAMKNEIINQLNEICADSTNIEISKYEIFKAARAVVGDIVNYHDVRNEVGYLINNYCINHNYQFIMKWNGQYRTWFITTEPVNITAEKKSRNRVYIPAEAVRAAGLNPGDRVEFHVYCNDDFENYEYIYAKNSGDIDLAINYNPVGTDSYTVEKDGGIRITAYPLEPTVNIEAKAGFIMIS